MKHLDLDGILSVFPAADAETGFVEIEEELSNTLDQLHTNGQFMLVDGTVVNVEGYKDQYNEALQSHPVVVAKNELAGAKEQTAEEIALAQFEALEDRRFQERFEAFKSTSTQATGRELIQAAKRLSGQDTSLGLLPNNLHKALLRLIRSDDEAWAHWTPNELMRRDNELFKDNEIAVGALFGGGQAEGAAFLDVLFQEAQK